MADVTQWVLVGTFLLTTLLVILHVRRRTSSAYLTEVGIMLRAGSEYAEKIRRLARDNPDFLPSIKILRDDASISNQKIRPLRKFLKNCDSVLKRGKGDEEEFRKLLRMYDRIQHLLVSENNVVR